ncbi:hypothetical protein VB711_00485 [Cronbergia sp. UHCC 0137]|uniref:hypothetical protein n=1 Tax=Cronbergia sp. UHCC 0137 TaxID=3110239 RepID=UPI002B20C4CC|nr:hypothetical protein [Cronbergia sp. UHCC 0137]MEA5616320.1 hypothetical protein [Cronbergia sp. UHCC 0137]
MVDRINDIAWQAHQGSVAAIIQVLNDQLANSGVRTRAMFSDGILQLLCESAKTEQLEQSTLVQQIQQILESIAPRNIRRVNINSRIVREDQLLWLEEINRDRENQLLWSQEIILSQPNILKQLIQDFTHAYAQSTKPLLAQPQSGLTNKNKYKTLTLANTFTMAAGLCSLSLLGWLVYAGLNNQFKNIIPLEIFPSLNTGNKNTSKTSTPIPTDDDPFAEAVRLANQASLSGKTATNATQWLELAAKWQRASDLMNQVPPSHGRYQEAQIRTKLYIKFSEAAQQEANKKP